MKKLKTKTRVIFLSKYFLFYISKPRMTLQLANRRLSYHKTGTGSTTLLLIPGGPGLTTQSLAIIHRMLPEEEFTVISYNASGVGKNETAPFYKSVGAYARELKDVIDALNVSNLFLLGHSWGSAVLQEFLALYPEAELRGVILVNTFSTGEALAKSIQARAATLPAAFHERYAKALAQKDGDALDALIGEYWFSKYICRLPALPDDIASEVGGLRDTPMYYYFLGNNLLNIRGALLDWDRSSELTQIKVPTLIMSGEFDYASQHEMEALAKAIPRASLWYEKEVSHFAMYEKPEAFQGELLKFLRANA